MVKLIDQNDQLIACLQDLKDKMTRNNELASRNDELASKNNEVTSKNSELASRTNDLVSDIKKMAQEKTRSWRPISRS